MVAYRLSGIPLTYLRYAWFICSFASGANASQRSSTSYCHVTPGLSPETVFCICNCASNSETFPDNVSTCSCKAVHFFSAASRFSCSSASFVFKFLVLSSNNIRSCLSASSLEAAVRLAWKSSAVSILGSCAVVNSGSQVELAVPVLPVELRESVASTLTSWLLRLLRLCWIDSKNLDTFRENSDWILASLASGRGSCFCFFWGPSAASPWALPGLLELGARVASSSSRGVRTTRFWAEASPASMGWAVGISWRGGFPKFVAVGRTCALFGCTVLALEFFLFCPSIASRIAFRRTSAPLQQAWSASLSVSEPSESLWRRRVPVSIISFFLANSCCFFPSKVRRRAPTSIHSMLPLAATRPWDEWLVVPRVWNNTGEMLSSLILLMMWKNSFHLQVTTKRGDFG